MRIGVVSDTHGFFDVRLGELLAGVELILHAGDVGKQEVLNELVRIAPVRAVRGNVDPPQLRLPLSATLEVGGMGCRGSSRAAPTRAATNYCNGNSRSAPTRPTMFASGSQPGAALQVEILHQLPVTQAELEKWANYAPMEGLATERRDAFLRSFDPNTRVVIFGHSHSPCAVALAGKLFFNPGSAGKQRFSLPQCCGLLDVSAKGVEAEILSLQRYNGKLPEKLWLAVGG